jgi:hypothetical protein
MMRTDGLALQSEWTVSETFFKPLASPCCFHIAIIYVLLTYGIKKILAQLLYLSIYITFYGKNATHL